MSIKDFKISAVDASKGLMLGEEKDTAEKSQPKVYGVCGAGYKCAGGGGQCGAGYQCAGG